MKKSEYIQECTMRIFQGFASTGLSMKAVQEQIPAIIDIAIVSARNMESNGITFDDTKPFQTAN